MFVLAKFYTLESLKVATAAEKCRNFLRCLWFLGVLCTFVGYCNYSKFQSPGVIFEKIRYRFRIRWNHRQKQDDLCTWLLRQKDSAPDVLRQSHQIRCSNVATSALRFKKNRRSCSLLFESHRRKL